MRLFWMIHKATVEKDSRAAWELIQQFAPLINNKSRDLFYGRIDEDLKSEMQITLYKRISKFKIDWDTQSTDAE